MYNYVQVILFIIHGADFGTYLDRYLAINNQDPAIGVLYKTISASWAVTANPKRGKSSEQQEVPTAEVAAHDGYQQPPGDDDTHERGDDACKSRCGGLDPMGDVELAASLV